MNDRKTGGPESDLRPSFHIPSDFFRIQEYPRMRRCPLGHSDERRGMAPRPTEVKAVVALLEGPADSAEDLAKRIINAVDEKRAERPEWIVVKATEGRLTFGYGTFPTQRRAEDAIAKGKVPIIEGEQFGICRLWSPDHATKAIEAADEPVNLREVPRKHPRPYAVVDLASLRKFAAMTDAQKKAAFKERLVK